ncbi:Anthranilate synthase, component I [gamma proteobacterium HdN1]|nr:Anthranilate synthase, component I [gamma proteobacterium HdN1]
MTLEEYSALAAQGFTHIPLMREVLADLETPLSTYLKLANRPHSFLLESVQGGEKWGRYSIIGLPCRTVMTVEDRCVEIRREGQLLEQVCAPDPLAFVQSYKARFRVPELPDLPRFHGGLVGYFGYDIVRYIEPRLDRPAKSDPLGTPDILLMLSEDVVVFDSLRGTLFIICHADAKDTNGYADALARMDAIEARLHEPLQPPALPPGGSVSEADFRSGFEQPAFEKAIHQIKDYVLAGDIMQVVLSQRMTLPFDHDPMALYRALRTLNPSPYMYFYNMGDFHIVGSSPEILARLDHGTVTVRPIAGTRRRGRTEEEDKALERELLADPKEIAEHLMLIDLGRNDVGRISPPGEVKVTEKMQIERYSHVMHIVSNVEGRLVEGKDAIDVLRAVFPAGTLSGAPKIRAMEIIQDLEPVKRGIYGGAVGYIAWNGNMDTAIAIRTAVLKNGKLHIQAGAGVVADSVPALEWMETQNKARAIFRAAAMAVGGLKPAPN